MATAGFVGRATAGPMGEARLVTTSEEFTAVYGPADPPFLSHAVNAYFLNGGGRLYVARHDGDMAPAFEALAAVDEISLVAAPADGGGSDSAALVAHAERTKNRFAIVDAPAGSSVDDVLRFRARFDSGYAAMYHPWVRGDESLDGLVLPPSGFVAGIYARGDPLKPPTGDGVRGAAGLESAVDREAQAVLNREGVNVLGDLEDEGIRLWGTRTMSSDPEWRYVNIRRYVIHLERSLDEGTRWAVFEPNGETLWAAIRRSIDDLLAAEWQAGHLMGRRPEDAYFVRCDRSTMTQDDLDHGRLTVLVGVAPVRPAEFVILRIGQTTAAATNRG